MLRSSGLPINRLLCSDMPWSWSNECKAAFIHVKGLLSALSMLTHYDHSLRYSCLQHMKLVRCSATSIQTGKYRPIAYVQRNLCKAEVGYSEIEMEALALIFGVKKTLC